MTLAEAIGQVLKQHRVGNGYSQRVLGALVDIHRPNIARLEAGAHEPSINTLRRLANAFGTSASALLYEAEILHRMAGVRVA